MRGGSRCRCGCTQLPGSIALRSRWTGSPMPWRFRLRRRRALSARIRGEEVEVGTPVSQRARGHPTSLRSGSAFLASHDPSTIRSAPGTAAAYRIAAWNSPQFDRSHGARRMSDVDVRQRPDGRGEGEEPGGARVPPGRSGSRRVARGLPRAAARVPDREGPRADHRAGAPPHVPRPLGGRPGERAGSTAASGSR